MNRLNYLTPNHQIYPKKNKKTIRHQLEHFVINMMRSRRVLLVTTIKKWSTILWSIVPTTKKCYIQILFNRILRGEKGCQCNWQKYIFHSKRSNSIIISCTIRIWRYLGTTIKHPMCHKIIDVKILWIHFSWSND